MTIFYFTGAREEYSVAFRIWKQNLPWDLPTLLREALQSKNYKRTSLVAQWLRICLPMQGTQVQALVQEDPTCCGATKPVHRHYWACALEPVSHNYWARMPVHLEPVLHNKRSHHN